MLVRDRLVENPIPDGTLTMTQKDVAGPEPGLVPFYEKIGIDTGFETRENQTERTQGWKGLVVVSRQSGPRLRVVVVPRQSESAIDTRARLGLGQPAQMTRVEKDSLISSEESSGMASAVTPQMRWGTEDLFTDRGRLMQDSTILERQPRVILDVDRPP